MRALLERSRSARRLALALAALGAVPALVQGASATDEAAFRSESLHLGSLGSELRPGFVPSDAPVAPSATHRPPRRIWAASRTRPLRIALTHRGRQTAVSERHRPEAVRFAQARPVTEPQVVFPKLIVLPKPPRPALVSIYQDRTLRDGDAVMMADGIHVFHGAGVWPYRPRDFVRLPLVAALDWHLRQTLGAFDKNPPVRWSSTETTAG